MRKAVEHATNRIQFGSHIREYGVIKEKLAHMAIRLYAVESLAFIVSTTMDRGVKEFQLEAAVSKIAASEAAWFVADETIQILGGMGFMQSAGVERVMRDLRIFRIFEGTNEILRLFMALTGSQGAGEHLKNVQKALGSPFNNTELLKEELLVRLHRMTKKPNVQLEGVHPQLAEAGASIERLTLAFGDAVDKLLIKHGKKIIHEQLPMKRVADALIDLFSMAVVVSRASSSLTRDLPTKDHERLLALSFCKLAERRVAANLADALGGSTRNVDKMLFEIADAVCNNGGYVAPHPLGF